MSPVVRAIVPRGIEDEPDPLAAVAAAAGVARSSGALVEAVIQSAGDEGPARELGAGTTRLDDDLDALREAPRPLLTLLPTGASDLAARLAIRLDGTALGRCESIAIDGGGVVACKAAFSGRARVTLRSGGNAFGCLRVPRTRFAAPPRASAGERRLEGARIVVCGGRGMGGPEGFALLRSLADALGGALGGSLPTVDAGWVPVARQVGQSGKYVEPEVYVAVGISGTPQHLAGIGPGTRIVAINRDAEAEIFRVAELGLVGDWRDVLPALIERLRGP